MKRTFDFPWTLAVLVLAIVATLAHHDALVADRRAFEGQWWRIVTGPFVHATWGHLVRDLALVAIAGIAYEAPLASRKLPLFACGIVLPALAVLVVGDVRWYCGLSGLSHALLAAALSFEFVRRRGAVRVVVLVLCAIAALKPLYELVTGAPAFAMSLGEGVVQMPLAHVVGVLVGITFGLLAGRDQAACLSEVLTEVRRAVAVLDNTNPASDLVHPVRRGTHVATIVLDEARAHGDRVVGRLFAARGEARPVAAGRDPGSLGVRDP